MAKNGEMPPRSPEDYGVETRRRQPVLASKLELLLASGATPSEFRYERVRQYSHAVAGAEIVTFLPNLIGFVVACRPDKQMIRVHARRIIAAVKDMKPDRDLSAMDFPRDAMRRDQFAGSEYIDDAPVSPLIVRPGPEPASIAPLNLFPEAFFQGLVIFPAHCESPFRGAKPGDASGVARAPSFYRRKAA